MRRQTKANAISRRSFGALLAQGAVAQQPETRPAAGSWRRPLVEDTPAFEGPIEYKPQGIKPKVEPFPMSQVASAARQRVLRRAGMESRLHGSPGNRPVALYVPRECWTAGRIRNAAGRVGAARKRTALQLNYGVISSAIISRPAPSWQPAATGRPRRRPTRWWR